MHFPTYLKEQAGIGLKAYTLPVGQCQQLVVIHHAVHAFNPHRVHIPIEQDVAGLILQPEACLCSLHVTASGPDDLA